MLSTCFIEERKELVPMILLKSNLNMTANLYIVNNINFKNIFKHLKFPHLSIPRTSSVYQDKVWLRPQRNHHMSFDLVFVLDTVIHNRIKSLALERSRKGNVRMLAKREGHLHERTARVKQELRHNNLQLNNVNGFFGFHIEV